MTMPEGTWTIGRAAFGGLTGMLPGVPGGGDALALPTEPGSLKPWVLFSSGPSKKLRLNSLPASNDTSGVRVSGAGALPRPALSDWSILKTSIVRRELYSMPAMVHLGNELRSPFALHAAVPGSIRVSTFVRPASHNCRYTRRRSSRGTSGRRVNTRWPLRGT